MKHIAIMSVIAVAAVGVNSASADVTMPSLAYYLDGKEFGGKDFSNSTANLVVESGNLDFNVVLDEEGISRFETGVTFLPHTVGPFEAEVRTALKYYGTLDTNSIDFWQNADLPNFTVPTYGIRGEYKVTAPIYTDTTFYGEAALEYVTFDRGLENGVFLFDPNVGVTYDFNEKVSVYAEVGYAWDIAGEDFIRDNINFGGYAEVGVPFKATDMVTITPSIRHNFDQEVFGVKGDSTQFNLETKIRF